jgi:hypothetical protein
LEQGIAPERLAIAGDSAGGGLTAATLLALRDAGDPPSGVRPITSALAHALVYSTLATGLMKRMRSTAYRLGDFSASEGRLVEIGSPVGGRWLVQPPAPAMEPHQAGQDQRQLEAGEAAVPGLLLVSPGHAAAPRFGGADHVAQCREAAVEVDEPRVGVLHRIVVDLVLALQQAKLISMASPRVSQTPPWEVALPGPPL